MKIHERFPLLFKIAEALLIPASFFLTNTNSLVRFRQFPDVDAYSDHEGDFLVAWLLAVVAMFFSLKGRGLILSFMTAWRQNVSLMLFLAFGLASIAWSVYVPATIYKFLLLAFSTVAASYIGVRYKKHEILDALSWIGGACALLSVLVVAYFPFVGIMQNATFLGSWTGIFWHRNHTGNLFAYFSAIFFFRLLLEARAQGLKRVILIGFYMLTSTLVFGSRSATGVIVFIVLHFAVLLIVFWLKNNERIKTWYYYAFTSVLLAGLYIFIAYRGFFFGLLGRSITMTGRVPLWQDLYSRVFTERPVLGYGYGALWNLKAFRIDMQYHNHWSHQIYFADNGFFDILLNVGLIGLALFLAAYIPFGVRSFKQAIAAKSWISFLPVLTFLYVFIGNLTYSFLLEVDQFVWMLFVMMAFATTADKSVAIAQP
ncbi:MAG: O-antigen ligase family protein [Anaerolineales bacterium]|nr:O-antigen ligase family protein [Anaerolineales bacterium]